MKFGCQIEIEKPIDRVVELFDDIDNLKQWQGGFIGHEMISGELGKVGSKSRLIYKAAKGEIDLVETIQASNLPDEFTALYESRTMVNTMTTRFTVVDEETTLYTVEVVYTKFIGIMPKLMGKLAPGLFKKQTLRWMHNFKDFVEYLDKEL